MSALGTLWKGIWRAGMQLKRGEFCTDHGSMWVATVDNPTDRPGSSGAFKMVAKSGQPVSEPVTAEDDATKQELASVLVRMNALAGYLACLDRHPDDPKRDSEAGAAYVHALPASLQERFVKAFSVPWNSAAESLRALRSALFTPEEEAQFLPPLPQ